MGLEGMIELILEECWHAARPVSETSPSRLLEEVPHLDPSEPGRVSRLISGMEHHAEGLEPVRVALERRSAEQAARRITPAEVTEVGMPNRNCTKSVS